MKLFLIFIKKFKGKIIEIGTILTSIIIMILLSMHNNFESILNSQIMKFNVYIITGLLFAAIISIVRYIVIKIVNYQNIKINKHVKWFLVLPAVAFFSLLISMAVALQGFGGISYSPLGLVLLFAFGIILWTIFESIGQIGYDKYNSFLDSYIINCIYAASLTLICAFIIYCLHIKLEWRLLSSFIILSLYLIYEISFLFFEDAFRDVLEEKLPKLGSYRSWPTIGLVVSTPLALIYFLARQKTLEIISWGGLKIIWAITRYNIIHPRWENPYDYKDIHIGKFKGLTSEEVNKQLWSILDKRAKNIYNYNCNFN
jgi:hypothetical protein